VAGYGLNGQGLNNGRDFDIRLCVTISETDLCPVQRHMKCIHIGEANGP